MAPSVSVSISICINVVVVAWATCILFVAACDLSSLEPQAKALQETGWWGTAHNNSSSRCNWYGVTWYADHGYVTVIEIDLTNVSLGTNLKLNFSSLPNLARLDLRGTALQGSIPPEIATLSELTYLDLSNNNFQGSIPLEIGMLSKLTYLNLSNNNLQEGSIPPEIATLSELTYLDLSNNNLGSICWPFEIDWYVI
ncbi:receptor-like protein 53 [Alnus glutinosa]|uniref:receptor-like protein 53 n=1 Tax=Alnus glutinosa TaxID=3517 RepID=UPI002D778ECA|nr:receptor-like protein 53 [Alnus glutinosa]